MKKILIPISAVSRFKWDQNCGTRLEHSRGNMSRKNLALAIAAILVLPEGKVSGRLKADCCSARYVQKLEKAEMVSVPAEVVTAITSVLCITVKDLLAIEFIVYE